MSKLEEKLNELDKHYNWLDLLGEPYQDNSLNLLSALRKALEQRDLSIYNLQAYLGTNIQKEISNKFDSEIVKILEGE